MSERDQLLAELAELWKSHGDGQEMVPDSNGTLRLSAGHVEGYLASDAVQHSPVTTVAGLVDKHVEHTLCDTDPEGQFACPARWNAV